MKNILKTIILIFTMTFLLFSCSKPSLKNKNSLTKESLLPPEELTLESTEEINLSANETTSDSDYINTPSTSDIYIAYTIGSTNDITVVTDTEKKESIIAELKREWEFSPDGKYCNLQLEADIIIYVENYEISLYADRDNAFILPEPELGSFQTTPTNLYQNIVNIL